MTPARVSNEGISMVLADLTKQVADIKERVTFNTQLLQEVVRQQKRGNDKDKIKLPCDMPLNSYEAVLEIEQKLKSKEFYSQLVYFSHCYCVAHFFKLIIACTVSVITTWMDIKL